ncbi:universal stress protein [Kaistella palustris]|uniref:universal stress protein n=1 Tax=Kaistella palustris TaxID=493376 RepID=UPI00041D71F5|nr:universal stress protein [Kaistella palustris]
MKSEIKIILVPTDFKNRSGNALQVAAKMAQRHNAKLIVTHVINAYYMIDHGGKQLIGSQTLQQNIDNTTRKLEALQTKLKSKYNLAAQVQISTQNIVDTINDFIVSDNVDVVVMGTSGKQKMKHFILGSTSYNALLHANCSVLLIPEKFQKTTFEKILFPVRVKHELHQKADLSVLLARKNNGDINLLGVGNPQSNAMVRQAYIEMKKNLAIKSADFISEFKFSRDSADLIAEAAKSKNSDIIMLADQDEDSWKSFMAENFFKKMINRTDIPLFIVKSKLKKIKNNTERLTGYDVTLPVPG